MKGLYIADNLVLPLDLVTQTMAILAKRRAGKSFTARRIAEQLLRSDQQVVIVDPKGDWWGIRSSADGRGPGLGVVILGGEHGDIPLEVHAGELVAKLVVEQRVSVLLDLSMFRKYEVATFMATFLENLYRLKAREEYRTPVMLIIDEADAIASQRPPKGEERMLGAAEDIVRRGGQRGIGCVMITQRSAVLNKNVLTQIQVLVAMRTISPQDLAAMDAWIDVHGTPDQRKTLMASLPSLPIGEAWFWSPGWPTTDGIFERVKVLAIETFDSGATPKPGEKRREPKNVADVDLEALKKQMADTIERARADDPKELRKRIAELERELKARPAIVAAKAIVERPVPVIKEAQLKRIERILASAEFSKNRLADAIDQLRIAVAKAKASTSMTIPMKTVGELEQYGGTRTPVAKLDVIETRPPLLGTHHYRPAALGKMEIRPYPAPSAYLDVGAMPLFSGVSLPPGELAVLKAAAMWQDGVARDQLSVLTGFKRSTRDAYISRLKPKGFIDDVNGKLVATQSGIDALGDQFERLPTGHALRQFWRDRLPPGEKAIFEILIAVSPDSIRRDELDARTGFKRSTRDAYLSRMASKRLVISEGRSAVRAAPTLF
jgi:uncharacterized protein